SSNVVRIDLLSKDNYDTWAIQMEAILTKNDAWGYVCGNKVKPEVIEGDAVSAEAARTWDIQDKKAKADIILSIKSSELKQIKGCCTSREVWLKLKSIYQSSGPARKATLLKQLTLHKMNDGGDVRDHLRRFFDTIDKLSEMDVDINADLLTIMLLYSLPLTFDNFRCAIESRDELPSPETLRIKIIEEYDARKNDTREHVPNAMLVKKQFGKRYNANKKSGNELKGTSKGGNAPTKVPFKYKCHRCGKVGHKAAECNAPRKEADSANTTDDITLSTNNMHLEEKWCLDSACTAHMANTNTKFANI
ncbi:Retrovirus-related Pol polyprotein from transposon TNT 1-94, partial [Camponotus floridanus]